MIIDTTAWSLLFRRRVPGQLSAREVAVREEARSAAASGDAVVLGCVRQELLNGLTPRARFVVVRDALRGFEDEPLSSTDYERAAEMFTQCEVAGVQGSDVDYLICSVAERLGASILTTDDDFQRYGRILPIHLHPVP